jgi:hypothetical protein
MYSLFLFTALVALQHWLNRRYRATQRFREGVAVTLRSTGDSVGPSR